MVNGYVTLDLASNNIYNESLNAIASGKPVMVVDAPNVYFADTIAISGDDVVITKGGKTITINDANAVSSVGDIQEKTHLYLINLVGEDSDANSLYVFMNLLTLRNDLTSENLIDYLKTYLANNKYQINGYNGDSQLVYTSLQYFTNNNEFRVDGVNDSEMAYTNVSVGKITKLF